jgi:hypothetical protein
VAADTMETVLADMRSDAAALRRNGDARGADLLERWAARWADATEDHRVFVSEAEALLTGVSRAALLRNFDGWAARGDARHVGRTREYRRSVLPARTPASVAREAGRQGIRPPSSEAA